MTTTIETSVEEGDKYTNTRKREEHSDSETELVPTSCGKILRIKDECIVRESSEELRLTPYGYSHIPELRPDETSDYISHIIHRTRFSLHPPNKKFSLALNPMAFRP